MTWPAVVFWIFLVLSLLSRGPMILYVGAVANAVGSLQMIPGELVGNTNFLPGSVFAMFLVIKILMRRALNDLLGIALDHRRLGILFAFYIWCLFSAFVMPRLFAGRIDVIPMTVAVPWPVLLQPSVANITQPAYLTISVFSALAGFCAAERPVFVKHWLKAMAVGGIALIATGLADSILGAAGLGALLEPFRNSSHSLILEAEIAGSRRVIGLMDEASSYGGACVGTLTALAFLRSSFEPLWRDTIVPLVILGLIVMAVLSTSSTAYVGLASLGLLYGVNWLRRAGSSHAAARSGIALEAIAAGIGLFAIVALVAFVPSVLDPVYKLLDEVVFNKASSSSFEERSMWTRVGLDAFFATYGLGVGFGSARTSNWFVAESSNTGVIGSVLLATFILSTLARGSKASDRSARELVTGLKFMSLPGFLMAALAGTSADVGGTFVYGMIIALTRTMTPEKAPNLHPSVRRTL